jgi:glycosyltransferase involved in cell wall biosynthesis
MDISIVIPLFNEEESLHELADWIKKSLGENYSYEVIFVDDGSRDKSWEVVQEITASDNRFKGIKFRRNYGKSAALNTGFQDAQGDVVITMDADLQDSPEEIPDLFRMIKEEGYDLVSGWKKKRYDPITKTIPSKLFNGATRWLSGIQLHDFNCGLKAYRNDLVKSIDVYGEMHRYIPVIAKWVGFNKIGEKAVQHQERKYGVTKFGLERFLNGFLDLLSITFITRFGKKPMHLFGSLGTLMFIIGVIASGIIGFGKLYYLHQGVKARLVTDNPWFYIALTMMILGTLLFIAGFLGELISRSSYDRNSYQVEERLGLN